MAGANATPFSALEASLRTAALAYPESCEEFPWGQPVFKARRRMFLMISKRDDSLHLTFKLPVSHMFARDFAGAAATGYGLGKSGWITLSLAPDATPDLAMLLDWLDESYRAVAPKALLKVCRAVVRAQ